MAESAELPAMKRRRFMADPPGRVDWV